MGNMPTRKLPPSMPMAPKHGSMPPKMAPGQTRPTMPAHERVSPTRQVNDLAPQSGNGDALSSGSARDHVVSHASRGTQRDQVVPGWPAKPL